MRALSAAERILQDLGVEEPEEIDLEAIAHHLGILAIRERDLDGCEARIIGCGDNAIISVSAASMPQRRRFSICHELGHWHHHRGQTLYCTAADIRDRDVAHAKEKVANTFAADLMLPPYLVAGVAADYKELSLKNVDEIRNMFGASRSATAIQLVKLHHSPTVLVCHSHRGKRWHFTGPRVPPSWSPRMDLGQESSAFDMVFGTSREQPVPRRVGAHVWFNRRDAERYEILEQSFGVGEGEVITLLTLKDFRMLDDNSRGGWL